jgi:sulfatase maturation enzyme AslB (radical SAM superfamily)
MIDEVPRFRAVDVSACVEEADVRVSTLRREIGELCVDRRPVSRAQFVRENALLSACLRPRTGPAFLEVLPTDRCNHACGWCFTDFHRVGRTISPPVLRRSLDCFVEQGGTAVLFSGGGEPLLHPSLIRSLDEFGNITVVEWLARRGVAAAVITNGVLLERFVEANQRNMSAMAFLRVSLDTTTAEDHARLHKTSAEDFQRIRRGIRYAIDRRATSPTPAIGVSFIVDVESGLNATECHLREVDAFAADLGVDFVQMKHRHTANRSAADSAMIACGRIVNDLPPQRHDWWVHRFVAPEPDVVCVVPTTAQVLRSDGRLAPCCHLQHVPLPSIDARTLPLFVVEECPSPACRYASVNNVLASATARTDDYVAALGRLRHSLKKDGFHPYRLYPSAPLLTTEGGES